MEFTQRINDGEETIARQSGEREDGHRGRNVLGEFGERADVFAPRPGLQCVDNGDERQGG